MAYWKNQKVKRSPSVKRNHREANNKKNRSQKIEEKKFPAFKIFAHAAQTKLW